MASANAYIQVEGLNQAIQYFKKFPVKFNIGRAKINKRMVDFLEASMVKRMPSWKNFLKGSIIKDSSGEQGYIAVTAKYARAIDRGFKPHWVTVDRDTRSGYILADWLADKGFTSVSNAIFIRHAGSAPAETGMRFVEGALGAWQESANRILQEEMDKVVAK